MEKYIVKQEEQGKRLDMYVTNKNSEITRTAIQRMIEQGHILVNGKKQKVAYKIFDGDVVTVEKVEVDKVEAKNESVKKPNKRKKENKIYYIQDDGYRSDLPEKYQDYLWQLCKKYKVTDYYELFIAQMYHESGFDESVISGTNDYGLMQINKCNHKWLTKELGNGDFLNPYNNMEAGVLIMSRFLQKYSDVHKALVCYNRGESAVINGTYSTSYSKCVISDMDKLIELK